MGHKSLLCGGVNWIHLAQDRISGGSCECSFAEGTTVSFSRTIYRWSLLVYRIDPSNFKLLSERKKVLEGDFRCFFFSVTLETHERIDECS